MHVQQLPLDTWIVVQYPAAEGVRLVSRHDTQREAEAERDRRNGQPSALRYGAYKVVEVVAVRMGGRCHSAVRTRGTEAD